MGSNADKNPVLILWSRQQIGWNDGNLLKISSFVERFGLKLYFLKFRSPRSPLTRRYRGLWNWQMARGWWRNTKMIGHVEEEDVIVIGRLGAHDWSE